MHSLDKYIVDIEPRIASICINAPKQEETSLQSSLSSYGWILLDSWIAWRTLRYLLRDMRIDDEVQDKWVQTPSSYTANQLRAAWRWDESVLSFIYGKTSKKLKELIDDTIQKKRNASAHFNRKMIIQGSDSQEIKKIYDAMSIVFNACELDAFIISVSNLLSRQGYKYSGIKVGDLGIQTLSVCAALDLFDGANKVNLIYKDEKTNEYEVLFEKDGTRTRIVRGNDSSFIDVVNDTVQRYCLLGNKGYYLDVQLFCNTVIECWDNDSQ